MGVVGGHEKRWAILGVMSLSLIIVMFNNVTLNVALPELSKDLGADNTELQWILDAYALIFGGTLLVMGALGDRFGRKPQWLLENECRTVMWVPVIDFKKHLRRISPRHTCFKAQRNTAPRCTRSQCNQINIDWKD